GFSGVWRGGAISRAFRGSADVCPASHKRVKVDDKNDLEHESVQSMGLNERLLLHVSNRSQLSSLREVLGSDSTNKEQHGGRAATPESGSAQFALLNSRHPIVVGVGSTMLRVEDKTAG
ncbi:hypothetical protein EDB85DRAFT_1888736, partial [Lactarius pseudohatsudake]